MAHKNYLALLAILSTNLISTYSYCSDDNSNYYRVGKYDNYDNLDYYQVGKDLFECRAVFASLAAAEDQEFAEWMGTLEQQATLFSKAYLSNTDKRSYFHDPARSMEPIQVELAELHKKNRSAVIYSRFFKCFTWTQSHILYKKINKKSYYHISDLLNERNFEGANKIIRHIIPPFKKTMAYRVDNPAMTGKVRDALASWAKYEYVTERQLRDYIRQENNK